MAEINDIGFTAENAACGGNQPSDDNAVPGDIPGAPDFQTAQEDTPQQPTAPCINQKKKKNFLGVITGSLVAVIAAAAVGITILLNDNPTASFENVVFRDGKICYEVSVANLTEKEALTAYLLDGEKLLCRVALTDEDGDGRITGAIEVDTAELEGRLAESDAAVSYRLTLKAKAGLEIERSFDSYLLQVNKVTSKFEDVSGECHCGVDGCYHFTMNFVDDLGVFSDFKATITDDYGNVAVCTFCEDLHAEQKIFIGNIKGNNPTFALTYLANGEIVMIETKIKI